MKMMANILMATTVFFLSACSGNITERNIQMEADVACRSIGAALEALAPYRQSLGAAEAVVQRIRVESDPLCTGDNPPRTMEVANRLTALAFDLMTVEKGVK